MQFDGASRGNPGPSGAGVVISSSSSSSSSGGGGGIVWKSSVWLGHFMTNNEAEYRGLIQGLQAASDLGIKV